MRDSVKRKFYLIVGIVLGSEALAMYIALGLWQNLVI